MRVKENKCEKCVVIEMIALIEAPNVLWHYEV